MKIIAIGHKARQGKDTFAQEFLKLEPDTTILHFADALKKEVMNADRLIPLIRQLRYNGLTYYEFLEAYDNTLGSIIFNDSVVPTLDNLFYKRDITEYWGMDGKDSEMLQFWGTDYRRNLFDSDYWIKPVIDVISTINTKFVLVPDTRFLNEYRALKALGATYIKVSRYEGDNVYVDPGRDPNHPSETDMDNIDPDIYIEAKTGDIQKLSCLAKGVLNRFA